MRRQARILIVGGGYVGLYAALGLEKRLGLKAEVTLVNPESFMVYPPFLPEAASGNLEPRHVVVPLRTVLRRVRLITGEVTALDHGRRVARVRPSAGGSYDLAYNVVVVAPGAVSRVLPVPGLAEQGIGFKSVAEAIYLRNQVLSRMDAAESTTDERTRRRALTFLFVGGGYAGVEALAELEDLARYACRHYRSVRREDMRWVLVEAATGLLPEIGRGLGEYALERLRRRGIEVRLATRLESAVEGRMVLSDGESFEADTLVWTTGVRAHPLVARLGFPVDERGRLIADEYLRVRGVEGAWTAGDCAAVPDLTTGGTCPPTAQHALRQGRHLAKNLVATLNSRAIPVPEPRAAGLAGALQGGGLRPRDQGPRLPRLVPAPDVPRHANPDAQPQGSRGRRLDARAVLPAGRGSARLAPASARAIRARALDTRSGAAIEARTHET